MLRLDIEAENPFLLVICGCHAEGMDGIVAATGIIVWPGHREGALSSIHNLEMKVLVLAASHPEIEPSASKLFA